MYVFTLSSKHTAISVLVLAPIQRGIRLLKREAWFLQ